MITLVNALKNYVDVFLELEDNQWWSSVDILNKQVESFSLSSNAMVNNGVYGGNVVGYDYKSLAYAFTLVLNNNDSVTNMINNHIILEKFSEWVKENNKKRIYPILDSKDKRIIQNIKIGQTPYVSTIPDDNKTIIYAMTVEIEFIEPK